MAFKSYYELTKSGLVFGNIITVIGGFALASRGAILAGGSLNVGELLATLVGIFLVMASGCVFNNYIDRDIDARMERTKNRALVTGKISGFAARVFGTVLALLGFLTLALFTNKLTCFVAFFGFFFYVFMYSAWFKRRSVNGTLVGAVSGAVPPVVGYCAAANRLDAPAVILFLIMFFWQMPHFYAIAIRRADDYAAAKIPVMPVKYGIRATKIAMFFYIIAFVVAATALAVFGYAGQTYLTIALAFGAVWLGLCAGGFAAPRGALAAVPTAAEKAWARNMFLFSLAVLIVLFITITIGAVR